MRRHFWKRTESQRGADAIERCAHCHTERVNATGTKTLYEYRGGKALRRGQPMPKDGHWASFIAGVVPRCVERP